jgi:Tfp pilus assembly ATPase PilU
MQGETTVADLTEKTFAEIGMDTNAMRNCLNDLRKMGEVVRVGTIRRNDRFVATWARV